MHIPVETILFDKDYFSSLIEDIEAAKDSIDMETYIFSNDDISFEVANALISAATKKVKVRLLIDGVGSRVFSTKLREQMQASGVEIKIYRPLSTLIANFRETSVANLFKYVNSRNHRKTCVIDGLIAYVGSANISDGTLINGKKVIWHDISVRLTGFNLDELHYAFSKAWGGLSFKSKVEHFIHRIEPNPIIRLNYSWRRRRRLYKDLLRRLSSVNYRICITNAYFVPKRLLLNRLIKAAKRGVSVTIILPKNPDVVGISLLARSFYSGLLKAGVNILQHDKGVLHTKFLMIDDWFCIGSSNFNHRSLMHDLEVDVSIRTPEGQARLAQQFHRYQKDSKKVSNADLPQSFFEKIAIWILWRLRWLF